MRTWLWLRVFGLLGLLLSSVQGTAQAAGDQIDEDQQLAESSRAESHSANFGPLITIESLEVKGNSSTADDVIKSALPIHVGDALRAGSPRLVAARYRILALGYFRSVELYFAKGSKRGNVVLVIEVVERGTIVLNRLYFGTANATPWWLGFDLGDRNFVGSGLNVSAALVVAGEGGAEGARSQLSAQIRISDSAFFGSRFGWRASLYGVNASEPYRVSGATSDGRISNFQAFDYRRLGGQGGLSWRLSSLSRIDLGARLEFVDAEVPSAPVQLLPDGSMSAVPMYLEDGSSQVSTLSASYDRDTRPDPVLPWAGDRLLLHGELGSRWIGGSYDFATLLAKYQRWWPVSGKKHVISAHVTGGLVLGDAPLFDRLHVGDLNRMVAARALGLSVSTTPSLDILGTSTDELSYGEVGGVAEIQYSYKLFQGGKHVYGGELFAGFGLWGLTTTQELDSRSSPPIDLLLDVGLRLDTEIGIFELSLANALGRLPL